MTMDVAVPADRYSAVEARGRASMTWPSRRSAALPDVREVGAGVVMPLTGNNWTVPLERTDQPVPPGERPPDVGWQLASAGFFRALVDPAAGRAGCSIVRDTADVAGPSPS